jgi:AcrR family transcriptional regulator
MYNLGTVPRKIPDSRFQDLIDAATGVFIAQGYQRTQMGDIAKTMGLAKGTVYLYVESKDALFDIVVRSADAPRPIALPASLPVRTPTRGRTLQWVKHRLAEQPASSTLRAALRRHGGAWDATELTRILRELFEAMARNRTGIKLVDRCAVEYPALAKVWFTQGREALLVQLTQYLERGIRARRLRPVPNPLVAARLIIETLVFWAVHRHWDLSPQPFDPRIAQDTVVQMLVGALGKHDLDLHSGGG